MWLADGRDIPIDGTGDPYAQQYQYVQVDSLLHVANPPLISGEETYLSSGITRTHGSRSMD